MKLFLQSLGKRHTTQTHNPTRPLGGEPAPKLVPWLKNLRIHLNYLQILQMSYPATPPPQSSPLN
jgi:hypothetical protein